MIAAVKNEGEINFAKSWGKANEPLFVLDKDFSDSATCHLAMAGSLTFGGWEPHPQNTNEFSRSYWVYEIGQDASECSVECIIEPDLELTREVLTVTVVISKDGKEVERVVNVVEFAAE